jgi:dTDP-4-dehydrorhamnose reductase
VSQSDALIGVLLVTGAGGMLGKDVVRVARARRHGAHGLARAKLDIRDPAAVAAALGRHQPEVVINCAAFTDVDAAESAEDRALAVNGTGPGLLAAACRDVGARLIHVSTDYVFDGQAARPYVESDPVAPRTAYGRTKLAGERAVLDAGGGHAIVRSSWLFGAGGRNFPATMLRLAAPANGGGDGRSEVSVVTDQVGAPTFTGHLAAALVELAERLAAEGPAGDASDAAGIHHIAGSGCCSWNEFAVEVFAQAGVACDVLPETTAALGRPAPRPPWSVLGSERPDALVLPAWQDGLSAYLTEIGRRARGLGEHEPQGVSG